MSNVIVDRQKIDILANAISTKSGVPLTMTLDEMVEAVDGIEAGGGEPNLQAKTYTVDSAGTATVTADSGYDGLSSVAVSVPSADYLTGVDHEYYTDNNVRKWHFRGKTELDTGEGDVEGWLGEGTNYGEYVVRNAIPTGTSVTPTEFAQAIGGINYMMESAVTVNAIPSNYVGSGIIQRSSSDLTASGATVTVPSGYYSAQASKAVASGTAGTPTATKGAVSNHQVSVTPSVTNTEGYISGGTKTGTAVSVSASELVSGTYTVDSSGSKDVTNYASASVPAGTAGTPSASKGAVSNHSISITPSVTNTTGWITGSTKTGTAVTVSASELASGNKAITQNGTGIDVVGYSTVSVNVSNNDVWKPIQAQTRTIIEDPNGNYLWYDNTTPAFAEGQTWRVTWGNETYIVQTKYVEIDSVGYWVIGNPGAIGYTDDGTGYSWIAWNQNSNAIAIGTPETGSKKVILELQQSNPYQAKTVTYIPSETQQTATVVPDSGYNGLSTVGVTVNAISSTYVGSGIARKSSTDLTVSGATVTAQAGYYAEAASKSVSSMTLPTTAASSATSGYTSKATIGRSTAAQYINIPPGYNSTGAYYVISAVANGSATAPSSISGSSATVTTGTNTITLTKTVSVTPSVTAGYVSSGTAGNSSVSLTASVTVNPTPTASGATVTIPAGYYSSQTTKSVSSGSASAPTSISGTSATVSTGTNTLTLTKTVSVTPTVSAGYVSSGTATNSSVSLTASVTTKAAATITPTTTNQTIAAGTYLTGTQTIAGDADLVGSNILSTANIFGVQGTVDFIDVYIRSAAPTSSVGNDGDIYIQE